MNSGSKLLAIFFGHSIAFGMLSGFSGRALDGPFFVACALIAFVGFFGLVIAQFYGIRWQLPWIIVEPVGDEQ